MAVTVKIEKVTPAKAKAWLELNTNNRRLKERKIQEMTRDMLEGRFSLNGETIKFVSLNGSSTDDRLDDGENRLTAVVRSGAAVEMIVVRGLAPDVLATIDAGAKRTMGDVLKLLKDEKDYALLAAVIGWAYRQEMRKGKDRGFVGSHQELLAYLDLNPSLRDATALAVHAKRGFALIKGSAFGAAVFHGLKVDDEVTRNFAEQIATGENLTQGQPAYVLREWLTKAAAAARNPSVDAYPAVINKALIAELEGRELVRLHYRPDQAFPYVQDAEVIEA